MVSIETLKNSDLFQGLTESQLEKIAHISKEEEYRAGARIVDEGEAAKNLYILQEGKVFLEMKIDLGPYRPSHRVTIDAISKGGPIGLSALIPPHIFRFAAVCLDPSKVIAIDGAKLRNLLQEEPATGYEVMKKIAELAMSRLVHTRQMLVSERGLALLSE